MRTTGFRNSFASKAFSVFALLVWCSLLVHLDYHHHDEDQGCFLCHSTQFVPAAHAPEIESTNLATETVSLESSALSGFDAFPLVFPRAPPAA